MNYMDNQTYNQAKQESRPSSLGHDRASADFSAVYNSIVSFIWGIADDCLRDVYVRGKYRDVILPMTVIRRLDAVLEDTKDDVLKMKAQLEAAGIINQEGLLEEVLGT